MNRLLIFIFLFLHAISPLQAATAKIDEKFTFIIKGKYGTAWYEITKDKNKWICKTESFPYFEAKGNPIDGVDLNKIRESKGAQNCSEPVIIQNSLSGKKEEITSCLSQSETSKLAKKLKDECRSKI